MCPSSGLYHRLWDIIKVELSATCFCHDRKMNIEVLVVEQNTSHYLQGVIEWFQWFSKEQGKTFLHIPQEEPTLAALAPAESHAYFLHYPKYRKLSHVDWFRPRLVEPIESRNGGLSSSPHPHGSYAMDIGVTILILIIIFSGNPRLLPLLLK